MKPTKLELWKCGSCHNRFLSRGDAAACCLPPPPGVGDVRKNNKGLLVIVTGASNGRVYFAGVGRTGKVESVSLELFERRFPTRCVEVMGFSEDELAPQEESGTHEEHLNLLMRGVLE